MNILYIKTDNPTALVALQTATETFVHTWEAHRQLAKTILKVIDEHITAHGLQLTDLEGIVLFQGPGSFTGLRIGASVANSLANGLGIPVVGAAGDDWMQQGQAKLESGKSDGIAQLTYGGEIHITAPKK